MKTTAIAIATCWTFASSKGGNHYQTLLYADGSTSCDCPGWCRRVAEAGSRSCRHTRSVQLGTADSECDRMHDYRVPVTSPITAVMPAAAVVERFGELGRRRLHLATSP